MVACARSRQALLVLLLVVVAPLFLAAPRASGQGGRSGGPLLGPRRASDLVVLTFFDNSLLSCSDVTTRVLADGSTVPFIVPQGRALVLQAMNYQIGLAAGGDNLFLLLRGPAASASVAFVPLPAAANVPGATPVGGSLPLPGTVVRPGTALCVGRNSAAFAFVQFHGYLTDDE